VAANRTDDTSDVHICDTHCHLDFNDFEHDREAVLARAWQAGVAHILIPGIDLASSAAVVSLAETDKRLHAAVGVHPNDLSCWQENTLAELQRLAGSGAVKAIGEIGLDYYRDRTPRQRQREVLRAQLELAGRLGLPVVLHNREASADMLAILADWQAQLQASNSSLAARPGVLHSFSAGLVEAEQALAMNFFIGITGPVTFRKAENLRRLVAAIPLERLLVETDAPFLTPHPYRGRRNEPAHVRLVVEKIAEIHDRPFAEVAHMTTENARRLFNW